MNVVGLGSQFLNPTRIDPSSNKLVLNKKIDCICHKICSSMAIIADSEKLLEVKKQILCLMQCLTVLYSGNEVINFTDGELNEVADKLSKFLSDLLKSSDSPFINDGISYGVSRITRDDACSLILISQQSGSFVGLQFSDSVTNFLHSINVEIPSNNGSLLNELHCGLVSHSEVGDVYIRRVLDAIGYCGFINQWPLSEDYSADWQVNTVQNSSTPVWKEQFTLYLSALELPANVLKLILDENNISGTQFINNWIEMGNTYFDFSRIDISSKDKILTAIEKILKENCNEPKNIECYMQNYSDLLGLKFKGGARYDVVINSAKSRMSCNIDVKSISDNDSDGSFVIIEDN